MHARVITSYWAMDECVFSLLVARDHRSRGQESSVQMLQEGIY